MNRIALGILAVLALGAPALAATEKQREGCAASAKIVAFAVEERARGTSANKIKRQLSKGENAAEERFQPAIGPLVDWVFTIEQSKLTADIAPAFEETCVGYTSE